MSWQLSILGAHHGDFQVQVRRKGEDEDKTELNNESWQQSLVSSCFTDLSRLTW